MAFLRNLPLVLALLLNLDAVTGCVCPAATVLSRFPSEIPAHACCLNFSGSSFGRVSWALFSNGTDLETLDLSHCNITSIVPGGGGEAPALRRLDLSHNRLAVLPGEFLWGPAGLLELDLSGNLLEELPEGFLSGAHRLQELHLQENRLRSLPGSVLQRSSLQRLELDGNLWDCSCPLLEGLEAGGNRTSGLQQLLGNLTCSSPPHLAGRTVWTLELADVCRPAALTALFIVLPLVFLSALMLCWCCGRKRKKKEASMLSSSKKRASGAGCSAQKLFIKQLPLAAEPSRPPEPVREGILKNQLFLRPASTLLGSTRDLYEEVEIKLGSVDSLPRAPSAGSGSTEGSRAPREPDGVGKTELDAVSVTEVMKDSADREKAYLTQSTEYYSLVPGIELEDSDHGEYESVDLS